MNLPNKFRFSDELISSLSTGKKTRRYTHLKYTWLKLHLTPAGAKTFYIRFRANKKAYNRKLGDFPQLSTDQAVKLGERFKAACSGSDPFADLEGFERQEKVLEHYETVNDVFQSYFENELVHRRTVAGRRHGLEVSYTKHLKPKIGHFHISELTVKRCREFFRTLEPLGYSVHNRCLTAIKSAFNYVIDVGDTPSLVFNPFQRVKKLKGVVRTRYLSKNEALRLLEALDTETNQDVADIYRLALFTGARINNVKSMRWRQIDMNSGSWFIESNHTKTGQNYEIALHSNAINILTRRSQSGSCNDFVFPSKASKYGYITGGANVWKSALKKADLYHENPNFRPRPHDLRRTFATWQLHSGADISVVSRALCHTSLQHTLIYARADVKQMREALDKAFDFKL